MWLYKIHPNKGVFVYKWFLNFHICGERENCSFSEINHLKKLYCAYSLVSLLKHVCNDNGSIRVLIPRQFFRVFTHFHYAKWLGILLFGRIFAWWSCFRIKKLTAVARRTRSHATFTKFWGFFKIFFFMTVVCSFFVAGPCTFT